MKTYKVELTEEFIKEAHAVACPDWKTKIKDLVPEAFEDKLEVGRWYKLIQDLRNPKVLIKYRGANSGYGINGIGDWEESSSWSFKTFPEAWQPATDKEVEKALFKEAKRRGLVEGAEIFSLWGEMRSISTDEYLFIDGKLYSDGGKAKIFEDGKWAKPIENPTLKRIQEIEAELKQLKEKL